MCLYDTRRFKCGAELLNLVQPCQMHQHCMPHIRVVLYEPTMCQLCTAAGLDCGECSVSAVAVSTSPRPASPCSNNDRSRSKSSSMTLTEQTQVSPEKCDDQSTNPGTAFLMAHEARRKNRKGLAVDTKAANIAYTRCGRQPQIFKNANKRFNEQRQKNNRSPPTNPNLTALSTISQERNSQKTHGSFNELLRQKGRPTPFVADPQPVTPKHFSDNSELDSLPSPTSFDKDDMSETTVSTAPLTDPFVSPPCSILATPACVGGLIIQSKQVPDKEKLQAIFVSRAKRPFMKLIAYMSNLQQRGRRAKKEERVREQIDQLKSLIAIGSKTDEDNCSVVPTGRCYCGTCS